MKISKVTIRALQILSKHPDGITAKFFASEMWPDSPAWERMHKVGINGVTSGKGMWLCAGSYLSKLYYESLVTAFFPNDYQKYYLLSSKGREVLKELK